MHLHTELFPDYFEAVHGHTPFPWQKRLLEKVVNEGWPRTIALPTASGKTAVMDVAIFALACQSSLSPEKRTAPRRVAMIVDRRIVVDDTYRRACRIREKLENNQGNEILKAVADALLSLGGEIPLDTALLRGGIYREDRWARTPVQPVILCSTVDQVGSRILFRGYGLSSSMWPIHAGLLANDTLIVLDEAHCSVPFMQTIRSIEEFRKRGAKPLCLPFAATAMTATPRQDEETFKLDDDDRSDFLIKKRLSAPKKTRLVELSQGKKNADGLINACIDYLFEHDDCLASQGKTILVVLNRVRTARKLRETLRALQDKHPHEALLLTGRSRPLERDILLEKQRIRLMAGRERKSSEHLSPLIIIATQCIEVGADIDADAMITEACPLDALRQRLGRLDRLGENNSENATCIVILPAEQGGDKPKPDIIYGESLRNTWLWLKKQANNDIIDCGTDALDAIISEEKPEEIAKEPLNNDELASEKPDEIEPKEEEKLLNQSFTKLQAPVLNAPVMFPVYCDLWCQTSPEPEYVPEPSVFLHGPEKASADVRLVWRADLVPSKPEVWIDTVSLCPPSSSEMLPVPIHQVRAWLSGQETPDNGDIEGMSEANVSEANEMSSIPHMESILRWFGPENSEIISTQGGIRPGDVLILPSSSGGCDEEGWNPESKHTEDLADKARILSGRSAILRLHPELLNGWGDAEHLVKPFASMDFSSEDREIPEDLGKKIGDLLSELMGTNIESSKKEIVQSLLKDERRIVEPHPSGQGVVIYTRRRLGTQDFTSEDATSFLSRKERILLVDHLADVAERAKHYSASLPEDLQHDIELAGKLHDIGKADPRMQVLLNGGSRIRSLRNGILAKSLEIGSNPTSVKFAREQSEYPLGARHELLSVKLFESCKDLLQKAHDRDLVLHLISSHHGHARPFVPKVDDTSPIEVSFQYLGYDTTASSNTGLDALDSGVCDRFWSLVGKYGWWGLSYLEACLRLADHRASETPSQKYSEGSK